MELNSLCAKKQKTFPVKSWKNCPIVNFKVFSLRKEKLFAQKINNYLWQTIIQSS
jgi:hypothetical protein